MTIIKHLIEPGYVAYIGTITRYGATREDAIAEVLIALCIPLF